ncbi:hypothetical protein AGR6A_Cc50075 [Agrobacterium sp. NCPPB 925]|nr:hypothetical protein AGR6A_Cc50075 [Agrobacterium sp. NCPPB 925]
MPDEISVETGQQDDDQSDRALDEPVAAAVPAMRGHEGPQKPCDEKTGGPADGAEACLNQSGDPVYHVVIVSSARGPDAGRKIRGSAGRPSALHINRGHLLSSRYVPVNRDTT